MRQGIFIIILIIKSSFTFCQDLIVTTKNDSINCFIEYSTNKKIAFTIFNEKKEKEKIFLKMIDVNDFQYDFYKDSTQENGISKINNTLTPSIKELLIVNKNEFKSGRFELGLYAGYGIRGKNSNTNSVLDSKLNTSTVFSSDIMFYNSSNIGIGLSFSNFQKSVSQDVVINNVTKTKNATIQINQILLLFGHKYELKDAQYIIRWHIGVGVSLYDQKSTEGDINQTFISLTDGVFVDKKLFNKLYISVGISHKTGSKYLDQYKSLKIGSVQFLGGLRMGI